MTKYCGGCKAEKPIEKFCKNARAKDGFSDRCRECASAYCKEWRHVDKDRAKAKDKATKLKHRFSVSLAKSRHVAKQQGHVFCSATEAELKAAFTGFCDVCGVPEAECNYRLCMDHCHITGELRGFLCGRCNKALGLFGDSDDILLSAMRYLAKHDTNKKVI